MTRKAIWKDWVSCFRAKAARGFTAGLILVGSSSPLLGCEDGIAVPDPENNPGLVADCKALLAARDKLAGNVFLDWDAEAAISSWEGLSVSGSPPRVSRLRLDRRQLTGTLPAELGQLTGLEELALAYNQLTGEIPAGLGQLGQLVVMVLHDNQLTGSLPLELGQLSKLSVLFLQNNQLSGELPEELSQLSQLRRLWLHTNRLTGEVPQWLADMSGLWEVYLDRNQLTGEIPAELSQLSDLRLLGLNSNQLTGKIPPELGRLTGLDTLWLANNELRGEIPAELSQLTNLTRLSLSGNRLTGEIPAWLGQMPNLQSLRLSHNQLTGPIPPELGQLTKLYYLHLAYNHLTGPIPPELGQLTELLELSLSRNRLSGEIPSELEQLTLLEWLVLDDNRLTGPIPPELGQLTRLELLYLNHNRLTGSIPPELGLGRLIQLRLNHNQLTGNVPPELAQGMFYVRILHLDYNELTGEIPVELAQLPLLRELRLSGNRLTGKIPAELGRLHSLVQLSLDNNQLTGEIPAELGNLPWLSRLHLQHNRLTGEIPAELGQLSRLRQFSFRGNRLTGPVPPELSDLPDVYVLNLAATRMAPDRIDVTWDDPGDPSGSYEYRLWEEGAVDWTEWAPIEDPETLLTKGEGLTIEWMLTDISNDAVYLFIEVSVTNDTGTHLSRAEVKRPVIAGPPSTDSPEAIFVPVLLTSAGRNNAFFTSELTLTNRGAEEATLHYTYTAEAGGGSGAASDTLAPERQRILPNAIDYLSGLGIPIPASGNRIGTLRVEVSGSSEVSLTTRTTTAVPDGRAGLAYPSIAEDEGSQEAVYLCGLRQNSQDRSNVAFQHMGSSEDGPITLRTIVYSGDPDDTSSLVVGEVELKPGGFHQYSGLLGRLGAPAQGYVKVEKVSGDAPFYAYGVINDNFNSDGSFVFPVTESSLVGTTGQTLPVIIETGSFQSELTVTNFSARDRQVDFNFVADGVDRDDDTATFGLTLKAGEQTILPDIVEELRGREVAGIGPANRAYVGALFATPAEGDMSGIVIGARTGAPDQRGGQYSLFYNGVPYGSATVESAWIYGLQQNAENRSNLALVNTGEIDDSSSTFEITVYDGSGDSEPKTSSVTLGPRRWHQVNGILGKTSQGYVQVRKVSGNNPFVAYGVINDGGRPGERSGDGAFLLSQE